LLGHARDPLCSRSDNCPAKSDFGSFPRIHMAAELARNLVGTWPQLPSGTRRYQWMRRLILRIHAASGRGANASWRSMRIAANLMFPADSNHRPRVSPSAARSGGFRGNSTAGLLADSPPLRRERPQCQSPATATTTSWTRPTDYCRHRQSSLPRAAREDDGRYAA
jgi:hypothetical protein